MPLRHRLAGAVALSLAATVPTLSMAPAHAGALGTGETVISGATTAVGVGESVAAALPDGRTLVVWEGVRNVFSGQTQGQKREIYGRVLDTTGAAAGFPVLLASMGATTDATQDAADPAVATRPDGKVVLVFAGDTIADTTPSPTPADTTSWQVQSAIVDPDNLAPVTPTPLTAVAPANAAFDQQHPDVVLDHGEVRVVWDGDTPATGDGNPAVWTTLLPADLSGTPTIVQVSPAGQDAARPRVAALTTGASAQSAVVWEAVTDTDSDGPVRRVRAARLAGTTVTPGPSIGTIVPGSSDVEQLAPDIAGGTAYRVVWSSNSTTTGVGNYRIWTAAFGLTQTTDDGTVLTSGAHDTWPTVERDTAQGQDVVSFSRRTSTAGTGHYEVMSARFTGSPSVVELSQVSTVDGDVSYDNAESMRPAIAAHTNGAIDHVWSRVRQNAIPGVAVRRSATLVDLTAGLTVTPARPSPARVGVNAADSVTVVITYGNASASAGTAPSKVTLGFPGFVASGGATITGPATDAGAGEWTAPRMNPGVTGTITVTGTMSGDTEGAIKTATAAIAAQGLVVDDPAANSTATRSVTVDYRPYVTAVTRLDATPNNGAVRWRVDFSEAVTGFDATDLSLLSSGVSGASVSSVVCGATSCTVTASATGNGSLTLRVPASATATDGTGKALATGNLPLDGSAYAIDTVAPTVTNTALGANPSNASQLEFLLDFSEPVTQPQAAQLTITGGTFVDAVRTNGGTGPVDSWTVRVSPSADGPVALTPAAGASRDAAGNDSVAGSAATTTSDRTVPVITLTGPTGPQRSAYDVTVGASETITGLTADDFTVTGGAVDSFTGSGPWTIRVQPDTEGPVVLRLPAGSVTDAAGNSNAVASSTTTYDVTRPGVTVSSAAGDPTGDNPISFTLTFTEPVTGLTVDELTVTGGTATLSGSGSTRTVAVVPAADGPVAVAVPADMAADAAGNGNTAGAAVTRTYDVTGPTPQITSSVISPTNAATFPVTVTWPEDVTGFAADDVTVTNGGVSDFVADADSATFTVTPASDGQVRVSVAAGAADDLAGNDSLAGTPLEVLIDTAPPYVFLSSSAANPTNADSVPVTVSFLEDVTGLDVDDFVATNATVSDLAGSGDTYTLLLSPVSDGSFGLSLPAGAVSDAAGNPSEASLDQVELTSDRTFTASLTYDGPALVSAPIALTLTLSDDVPVAPGDFATNNGTVTSISGSGRVLDVVFTPDADGPASVRLAAGVLTDAAGNTNGASETVTVTHDAIYPFITAMDYQEYTHGPFEVGVTFSEPVLLSPSGIFVVNGSLGQVSGSGTDWSFEVIPSAEGVVGFQFMAGATRDLAGNPLLDNALFLTVNDTIAPKLTLSSPTSAVVATSPIPVVVDSTEPVSGLGLDDFVVTNGTLTNLVGGGNRWTADLVPAAEGDVTLGLKAGAAVDQAGNPSEASTALSREFDSARPTLALTSTVSGATQIATIPVLATFSKRVLGFDESDLRTTNASVSGFTKVDDRTWRFDLVAGTDGEAAVRVPDNAASSAGGNLAFGASYAVTVDRAAPVLLVSGPSAVTESGPVTFTLTSSEAVTGLDAADLSVSGSARPRTVVLTPGDPGAWQVTVDGMAAAGDVELAVRPDAVSDAAGNTSARAAGTAAWRPTGSLRTFELLQQPGTRQGNRVSIPVAVDGTDVTFTATSSNGRLLPASAISVTGNGAARQLTLAARADRSGASRVVVTARAGSVTRTLRLRLVVDGDGDERLKGSAGIDVILARLGSDTLLGRGGDDHLYGGYGPDRLVGGSGDDVLVGGPGRDELTGGAGGDLFATWGNDRLVDVQPRQGDRVVRVPRSERRLLGP